MGFLSEGRKPTQSKLQPANVMEVKMNYEKLIKRMSIRYNVSTNTIRNILQEKTWRHIKLKRV